MGEVEKKKASNVYWLGQMVLFFSVEVALVWFWFATVVCRLDVIYFSNVKNLRECQFNFTKNKSTIY